jgi:hypothetical protein
MSNRDIDEIAYLYGHISNREYLSLDPESEYFDQELADLVENIISTISFNMINEGYSAEGIINFLENSSEESIVEYYFNLPLLDENFVLDESTLIEFARLEEALGSALKLLSRGLKPAARTLKVATQRAMGPGARKVLTRASTKVKDVASKVKGSIPSKEKVKSGAKTALGLGAATLAGYAGGRAEAASGGDAKTSPSDTKSSPTPPKSQSPSPTSPSPGPSGTGGGKPSGSKGSTPPKPSKDSDKGPAGETPMQKWARLHPKLAAKVKPGQSGYEDISAKREKPGPNEKQDQTPTTGNPKAKIDTKSVEADLKAQQERDKKRAESSTKKESYDAYDIVLDYLFETNQVDTLAEASYVMMEMDSDAIQSIVLEKSGYLIDEYNLIVEGLLDEGYDLSNYTEDEFIDMLIAENILPSMAKLIVGINKARGMAKTVATSPATKQLGQTLKKAASDFGAGFKGGGKGGALVKSPGGAMTKAGGKSGALVKSPSGALAKGGKGGKIVDASIKPVNVNVVGGGAGRSASSAAGGGKGGGLVGGGSAGGGGGKGGALVASPKGVMTKAGGKGGALVAGTTATGVGKAFKGAAAAARGRGGKGGLIAAGLLGAGAAGAGMFAAAGKDKKTSPRRQEALVGSQNAEKPLTASPNNMAVAKDINKQGGVALGKGGLGYLAQKGDKMVVKQAKAVGADDGVIGKAARALGLTKAKDKAIEAQRQAAGRANREKYLSGQGLTDKNITGYQAKGAKRKGETTGTKIKMDNN